ncbi:MAG TPA: anti-sigma factor [Candidatus Limnocylindrales bacterium]|nr:anti-sigma factor [Candidatus Limnocylindrales bacterium]
MSPAGDGSRAIGHDEALDLATAGLDAPLAPGDASALEAHLGTCPTCTVATASMRHDAERLSGLPRHDAPERIRQVVVTSVVAPGRPHRGWVTRSVLGGLGVLVAIAALLVASTAPVLPDLTSRPAAYVWKEEMPAASRAAGLALSALASDGGTVVALGAGPAGVGAWRSDGSAWQAVPAASFDGAQVAAAVSRPRGFVAVGYAVGPDGASEALSWTSSEGSWWTRSQPSPELERAAMADVVADGDGLLAVGLSSQPEEAAVWRSADGLTWTQAPWPSGGVGARMNSVARRGHAYVAVGQDAAGAAIWWSSDGQHFDRLPLAGADGTRLVDVTAGGPGFVAVGWTVDASQQQHAAVWTSADGLVWNVVDDAVDDQGVQLSGITVGMGRLTAVGRSPSGAVAYVSLDGRSWQALPAGPGFDGAAFQSVLVDKGRLLVAGAGAHGPGIWQLERPDTAGDSTSPW